MATMKVEYKCPNCGHHLFDAHYDPSGGPPPHANSAVRTTPSSNYGSSAKDALTCPRCNRPKQAGFDTCYECAQLDMEDCPNNCGRKKKKQYPVCYQCSQQGQNAGGSTGYRPQSNVTEDEDDDVPF